MGIEATFIDPGRSRAFRVLVGMASIRRGTRTGAAIDLAYPAFRLKLPVQSLREMTECRCGFPEMAILICQRTQFRLTFLQIVHGFRRPPRGPWIPASSAAKTVPRL